MTEDGAGFVGGVGPGQWDDAGEGNIEMSIADHSNAVWNGITLLGRVDKNGFARVRLSFKEEDGNGGFTFASDFSAIGGGGKLSLVLALQASKLQDEIAAIKSGEHSQDSDDEFVAWLNEVTDGVTCPLRIVKTNDPDSKSGVDIKYNRPRA